jgi:alkyldihydroxyacetonephosphate synthase
MLTLAGHGRQVALLETWLRCAARARANACCWSAPAAPGRRRAPPCAPRSRSRGARRRARGKGLGERWKRNRFRNVYLRNSAWAQRLRDRHGGDGARLAARDAAPCARSKGPPHGALARDGERVHAYTHLSHLYPQGASVYSTFIWRLAGDYDADLARWRR